MGRAPTFSNDWNSQLALAVSMHNETTCAAAITQILCYPGRMLVKYLQFSNHSLTLTHLDRLAEAHLLTQEAARRHRRDLAQFA